MKKAADTAKNDQAGRGERMVAILLFLLGSRAGHDAADIRARLQAMDLLDSSGDENAEKNRIRTVQRDLDALSSSAGGLIEREQKGRKFVYRITQSPASFLHVSVEDDEVAGIIALRGLARHFGIKEAESGAEAVLRKMAGSADAEAWIDEIDGMIHVFGAPASRRGVPPEVFTEILGAIHGRMPIQFQYPVSKPRTHTVVPLRIIVNRGEIYLVAVGAADLQGKRFYYKLSRVVGGNKSPVTLPRGGVPLDEAAWNSLQKRMDTMLKKVSGIWDIEDAKPAKVSLLCDASIQVLFEEQPYAEFEIAETTRSDGRIRLTMNVPVSFSLVQWILQWGSQVVVEKPAELKKQVGEVIAAMAAQYL